MSVTQHTDTYWTNRFGGRFQSEAAALEDERRRLNVPWRLRVLGSTDPHHQPDPLLPQSILAIDDSKAPFTGQPDGTAPVWLFKDLVAHYTALMEKHGELAGYTRHHCGMGRYTDEIVRLEPNP